MSQFALDTAPTLVKEELLALGLVTPSEWLAAATTATSDDPVAVIPQLLHMPAAWAAVTGREYPVLTAFQAEWVGEGRAAELLLDHYILLEKLGSGGCGDVYSARNLRVPRVEAVKILRQSTSKSHLSRFEREVWCLAHLRDRGFTSIHYANRVGDVTFYAMELVEGNNLRQLVEDARTAGSFIKIATAVAWALGVASALLPAHERGIVHRDVKPENVMVTTDGGVKLLDWSIAKLGPAGGAYAEWTAITAEATPIGTAQVMPVEQWGDGRGVTAAADIYSLGCTLFYALTGRMPFESSTINGLMMDHAVQPPPAPSDIRLEIPEQLDRVVLKMLAKTPADRYPTATELIGDLRVLV